MCIRDRVETEIVYSPMVAEPQEYRYNADAFEARGVDDVKPVSYTHLYVETDT